MEQHRTLQFEGKTIHYRDEGRENPRTLVLLHGFMQNLDVWSAYTLWYMRSMRVVCIDLPGHGLSATYGEVHTMDFMARAVRAVLADAGVEQCVMAGHSMGGYVALAFAENYPFLLRGLALLNSHALADSPDKRQSRREACEQVCMNRAGYIVGYIPPLFDESRRSSYSQEIKDLQDQCLEMSAESIVAAQAGMAQRPSRMRVLEQLEVPVLFVFGKGDTRIPLELGVSQALVPHHAEIMVLDKVGHMSFMEERDYVRPRLQNFVETCYA
ncbi:MAG: alpha/beta fold hydrolase [Bacteroidales bacterium]|nr:alpha/beta fold hydrolase [Bacteroidales bacterium]